MTTITTKVLSLMTIAAVGWLVGCGGAGAQATAEQGVSATAAAGDVPATAWCSGGSTNCTATAACPGDMEIVYGYWWYIVPDGVSPAYGICGSNSGTCQPGQRSCAFTTSISRCSNPGWSRQMGFIYSECRTRVH